MCCVCLLKMKLFALFWEVCILSLLCVRCCWRIPQPRVYQSGDRLAHIHPVLFQVLLKDSLATCVSEWRWTRPHSPSYVSDVAEGFRSHMCIRVEMDSPTFFPVLFQVLLKDSAATWKWTRPYSPSSVSGVAEGFLSHVELDSPIFTQFCFRCCWRIPQPRGNGLAHLPPLMFQVLLKDSAATWRWTRPPLPQFCFRCGWRIP